MTHVRVRVVGSARVPPGSIVCDHTLLHKLGYTVTTERTVQLGFGLRSYQAALVTAEGESNSREITVSPDVASALLLPAGCRLNAVVKDGVIRFGPLVGILSLRPGDESQPEPYGQSTELFAEISARAPAYDSLVVVFAPRDIDEQQRIVKGRCYDPGTRRWKMQTVPIPDFVYVRIPSRRSERLTSVKKAVETLKGMDGVVCFNRSFLDKWDTHTLLVRDDTISAHLPHTETLRDVAQIETLASRYHTLYVKPRQGSHGVGIVRIRAIGGRFYEAIMTAAGGMVHVRRYSPIGLGKLVKALLPLGYIVQEGLPLLGLAEGMFDVRLLLQRSSGGGWTCPSIVARIGPPHGIISNVAGGGRIASPSIALRHMVGGKRNVHALYRRMYRVAARSANLLETGTDQSFLELGFDIGVGRDQKFWILEVNSRPGRQPVPPGWKRRSIGHLLRYLTAVFESEKRIETSHEQRANLPS